MQQCYEHFLFERELNNLTNEYKRCQVTHIKREIYKDIIILKAAIQTIRCI